jgi:uncharacterized protein with NRDE domain
VCLAVIALDRHPRYALIIAANRDEFHARPTERAHWWKDAHGAPLLAGRDLDHGGTWLGVTRRGRFAFITNVREPGRHDPLAPSRGSLVPAVLRDADDVPAALESIVAGATAFNGFNLVAGDRSAAAFASNRVPGITLLRKGVHGVSNARLDTPWPKLDRAKAGVERWAARGDDDVDALFAVLADRVLATDAELPATGIPLERERLLSAPFIVSADYGTRSSTILAVARDGTALFVERTFNAAGEVTGDVEYRFRVTAAERADVA